MKQLLGTEYYQLSSEIRPSFQYHRSFVIIFSRFRLRLRFRLEIILDVFQRFALRFW